MFNVSSTTVAIVAIVVLLGIMLFSGLAFKSQFVNPRVTFKEEPLTKNKEFQLIPGEQYKYGYLINNTEVNVTYAVMEGQGCTVILLTESINRSEVCVGRWGVDQSGSNSTFMNPSMLLFKPWMLALHETWRWNASMYMTFGDNEQHLSDIEYRVMRTENYRGRMSFVVEISSDTGTSEYQWIDMEKRVLLRTVGEGYEVAMTEGLPLN